MFIGHFALGFAAKSLKPSISLGTYFVAVQFVDLLWPTLLLLGIEEVAIAPGITEVTPLDFVHYPVTHSLLMAFVWAAAASAIIFRVSKDFPAALLVGMCVASHWVLDFLTHRPDLPLDFSETTRVGLGLWNYKAATLIIESSLFALCAWAYARKTSAVDKTGSYAFWGLIAFFLLIHVSNFFGPPPPSVAAIAWAGHLQWLFVAWAYWIDKHRT